MLQIISGKFFDSEDRFHTDCKGILYSNSSFRGKYDIGHIKIESTESLGNINSYIISYDNQLQKSNSGFELVKVGDEEILRQFKNIFSFVIDAVFDEEKSVVERICKQKENGRNYPLPSEFVDKTLTIPKNISEDEISTFKKFFEHLINLSRYDYNNILNCIVAYNASIRLLSEDVSLSYSMLVYCLESLSQSYDSYIPVWEDYNENKKKALEKVFNNLDDEPVEEIKSILLKDEHLKLSKRFCEFVKSHVKDDFFEYNEGKRSISKDEFQVALLNAYYIRSKYAHMLKPLIKHLRMGEFSKNSDIVEFQHDVFFTYAGLLRVVREVILNFTFSCEKTGYEKFDWRGAIPGCIELKTAPYYWIWKMDSCKGEGAKARLEGFIETFIRYKDKIPKMDELVRMYLSHLSEMKEENRIAAFTLCCLYVGKIGNIEPETKKLFESVFEKHKGLFNKCSIYGFIIFVMRVNLDISVAWETDNFKDVIATYCKKRYKDSGLKLPKEIETMIYLKIANSFQEDNLETAQNWKLKAYDNLNNNREIQELVKEAMGNNSTFDINSIWQIIDKRFDKKTEK